MNIVFFGMSGPLSRLALRALIRQGITPSAILTPALASGPVIPPSRLRGSGAAAGRRWLPTLEPLAPSGLADVAASHDIRLFEVRSVRSPETLATLARFQPDLIAVACFPWRLPDALLHLPRLGCINLHPSLLPRNRGPDPLFWTFRTGEAETGVTVHQMTTELDAGPILVQRAIPVQPGVSEVALEIRCGVIGGGLLAHAVYGLESGSIAPTPQDERLATQYPSPGPEVYAIDLSWSARRCDNFTRGIIGRGQPITVSLGSIVYRVVEPLGVAPDETLGAPYLLSGDKLALRCGEGVWRARVAPL